MGCDCLGPCMPAVCSPGEVCWPHLVTSFSPVCKSFSEKNVTTPLTHLSAFTPGFLNLKVETLTLSYTPPYCQTLTRLPLPKLPASHLQVSQHLLTLLTCTTLDLITFSSMSETPASLPSSLCMHFPCVQ